MTGHASLPGAGTSPPIISGAGMIPPPRVECAFTRHSSRAADQVITDTLGQRLKQERTDTTDKDDEGDDETAVPLD